LATERLIVFRDNEPRSALFASYSPVRTKDSGLAKMSTDLSGLAAAVMKPPRGRVNGRSAQTGLGIGGGRDSNPREASDL
jgi:hypothetical protein